MTSDARGWLVLAVLVVGPWWVGCEEEDIRVYEVPKDHASTAPPVRDDGEASVNEQAEPSDGEMTLPEGHPPLDGMGGSDGGADSGAAGGGAPMMPGGGGAMVDDGSLPAAKENVQTPLTYTVPDGWREGSATRMRVATLYQGEGDAQWELSVIPLGGGAGGMLANVNRWAQQIGAERWSAAEMDEQATSVEVGGERGMVVELRGEEEAILGAIVPHEGMNWFFKAWGPAERFDAVKPGFERFLGSVRWGGDDSGTEGEAADDEASDEPTGESGDPDTPSDPAGSSEP